MRFGPNDSKRVLWLHSFRDSGKTQLVPQYRILRNHRRSQSSTMTKRCQVPLMACKKLRELLQRQQRKVKFRRKPSSEPVDRRTWHRGERARIRPDSRFAASFPRTRSPATPRPLRRHHSGCDQDRTLSSTTGKRTRTPFARGTLSLQLRDNNSQLGKGHAPTDETG